MTLKAHGLKGKLTGAGGGGYAISLIPPSYPRNDLDAVVAALSKGFLVKIATVGDEGVRVDS